MAGLLVVLFVPLNLIQFLGYLYQPTDPLLGPGEIEAVQWVQTDTPREAVFIDSGDRMFLAPTAPRRYFWGSQKYASQWGYNKKEMDRRRKVRDNLYSAAPIERSTFEALSQLVPEIYVIVRSDRPDNGAADKFSGYPDIFLKKFTAGPITIYEVDRGQCRLQAAQMRQ